MIGLLEMELYNDVARSLKDKRRELNRLIDHIHAQFNVAVAEVDGQDLWQRTRLAVAAVSNDARHNTQVLQRIVNIIQSRFHSWQLLDFTIQEVY